MSYQLSAMSYQLSAISYQLSAMSYELSAMSYELCANLLLSHFYPLPSALCSLRQALIAS